MPDDPTPVPDDAAPAPEVPAVTPRSQFESDVPLTMNELAPYFANMPATTGELVRELAVCRYRLANTMALANRLSMQIAEAVAAGDAMNRATRRRAAAAKKAPTKAAPAKRAAKRKPGRPRKQA